jgi:hypothetical protein
LFSSHIHTLKDGQTDVIIVYRWKNVLEGESK